MSLVLSIWFSLLNYFRGRTGVATGHPTVALAKEWRCYSVGPLAIFDQYRLEADGSALLGGIRFKPGDVVDLRFSNHHATRPALPDAHLCIERPDGTHTLSMVAPNEWGRSFKYSRFLAKCLLLADHTWDVEFNEEAYS